MAVLIAALHTVQALHVLWFDTDQTTYTHGHLVALVSLWLLWQGRKVHVSLPAQASKSALLALFGAGAAWLVTVQAGIQLGEMLLLPVLLALAVWASQGFARARQASFAFAYLYFAMPVWTVANDFLQWGTIYANRVLLRLVGIPTFFEGNAVQIPDGVFHIEGGCSGLHFFMVALAIAALLGELRRDRWATRLKLLLLAAVLAVLTNWVRVFTIILAGHVTHMQSYLVRVSHYGYGWVLFAVSMALFFWLERKFPQDPDAPVDGAVKPAVTWRKQSAMIAVLAFVSLWHVLAVRPAGLLQDSPAGDSGWQQGESDWHPILTGGDATRVARYSRGTDAVDLATVAYGHQEQNREFSAYANNLLGSLYPVAVPAFDTAGLPLRLEVGRDATGIYLVGVDYLVDGRAYTSAFRAQLRYAQLSLLSLRSPPTQMRVFRAVCRPDCAAAATLLKGFLPILTPQGRKA
jgi:exosortase